MGDEVPSNLWLGLPLPIWLGIGFYFWVINVATFLLWWHDKRASINKEWRISEHKLLMLCALGGTPAGLIAANLFRHKTIKKKFINKVTAIVVVQVICVCCLIIFL